MGKRGFQQYSCSNCHRRKVRCELLDGRSTCRNCLRRSELCNRLDSDLLAIDVMVDTAATHVPISDAGSNTDRLPVDFGQLFDALATSSNSGPLTDDEFQTLMTAFLDTSMSGMVAAEIPIMEQDQRAVVVDTYVDDFFESRTIPVELVTPYRARMQQTPLDPVISTLRSACACLGILVTPMDDGERRVKRQTVALEVSAELSNLLTNTTVSHGPEILTTMVLMQDVWRDVELQTVQRVVTPLWVDLTSVEAICRLHNAMTTPMSHDLTTYVFLLDAMEAADTGRPPFMRIRDQYTIRHTSDWLRAAWQLGEIGIQIATLASHAEYAAQDVLERLKTWHSLIPRQHTMDQKEGSVSNRWEVLMMLRHHCVLAVETHCAQRQLRGIPAMVELEIARAHALTSWANIVTLAETNHSVFRLSVAMREIGIGCLFWGLNEAKSRRTMGGKADVLALLDGSRKLEQALESVTLAQPALLRRLQDCRDVMISL